MSSYSFSHQFYQHWTSAPQAVRAAIVQELKDITALLQTETSFKEFVFSNHDLDAHLDDLYSAYDKQQAIARELADRQAALRAEAEQQRLAEERSEQQRLEKKRLEEEKLQIEKNALEEKALAEAEQQVLAREQLTEQENNKEYSQTAINKVLNTRAEGDKDLKNPLADTKPNLANINAIGNKTYSNSAIDLSLKDTELNAAHQQMIQELEIHIDDYLTEQMLQMSENLKSWLRAEVTHQLNEKPNDELNKK